MERRGGTHKVWAERHRRFGSLKPSIYVIYIYIKRNLKALLRRCGRNTTEIIEELETSARARPSVLLLRLSRHPTRKMQY